MLRFTGSEPLYLAGGRDFSGEVYSQTANTLKLCIPPARLATAAYHCGAISPVVGGLDGVSSSAQRPARPHTEFFDRVALDHAAAERALVAEALRVDLLSLVECDIDERGRLDRSTAACRGGPPLFCCHRGLRLWPLPPSPPPSSTA